MVLLLLSKLWLRTHVHKVSNNQNFQKEIVRDACASPSFSSAVNPIYWLYSIECGHLCPYRAFNVAKKNSSSINVNALWFKFIWENIRGYKTFTHLAPHSLTGLWLFHCICRFPWTGVPDSVFFQSVKSIFYSQHHHVEEYQRE